MGHLICRDQLFHFLRTVGCDTDAGGRFNVDGTIVSFMGAGEEYVIGDDAVFYRQGKACSLAINLQGTSYGTKMVVI